MNRPHEEFFQYTVENGFLFDPDEDFKLARIDDHARHARITEERRQQICLWAQTKLISSTTKDHEDKLYKTITDPYEIRVLEIKPGEGDERLKGSLHHFSVEFDLDMEHPVPHALSMNDLAVPVFYTALGYTLGPQVFDVIFECGGHVKNITKSLECALRYLRRKDRSIMVWIDRICINQNDTDEKRQQIPLMSRIYRFASNTAIWLGEPDERSDSALRLIDDIHKSLQFSNEDLIEPDDFERRLLPGPDSVAWEDLWSLLLRKWFKRLWIIQEVILSREPWVVCGDSHITWEVLARACVQLLTTGISGWLEQKFAKSPKFEKDLGDVCKHAWELDQLSWMTNFNDNKDIFELLVMSRDAQSYGPRDKIYGLFGVCGPARTAIQTSYASDFPATRLYHEVMIHHWSIPANQWTLASVPSAVDHHSLELPSWVPDWQQPRRTTALGYAGVSQGYFKANGPFSKTFMRIPAVDSRSLTELPVRGLSFDVLVKSSGLFRDPDLKPTAQKNKTLLDILAFFSQLEDYPTPDTIFSVFWQIIVAGKDDRGRFRCPDSFEEIVSHLLDLVTRRRNSLQGQTYTARQNRPQGRGGLDQKKLKSRKPGSAGDTFQKVRTAMINAMKNRRLGLTEKGYIGLFAEHLNIGDQVWILDGCHVPFLLRPTGGEGRFRLIGECYVHGIMGGEAVDSSSTLRDIALV